MIIFATSIINSIMGYIDHMPLTLLLLGAWSRLTLPFEIANNKQQSGFWHYLNVQITYPM